MKQIFTLLLVFALFFGFASAQVAPAPGVDLHTQLVIVSPNPVRAISAVKFTLDQSSKVTIVVYNILGAKVSTLLDGAVTPEGEHEVSLDAAHLTNGFYFVKMHTSTYDGILKVSVSH